MAISLTLTRCAILIFFVRTLYTKMYPRLRHTGIYKFGTVHSERRKLLLIDSAAYCCIIIAIAFGLASVITMALHCRPIKYNYTIPLENPRYCFRLRPFVVSIAILSVLLDALVWYLPHHVVWNLQLRLSHKLAISAIFAFGLLCDAPCKHMCQSQLTRR
jgi:hypothetical protein